MSQVLARDETPLESVGIREDQSSKSFLDCHLFNYFHTSLIWSKKMSSYITRYTLYRN